MSEKELIQGKLRAVAGKLKRQAILKFVTLLTFWVCVAFLLVIGAYKLLPFPEKVIHDSLYGAVVFVAASVLASMGQRFLAAATCIVLLLVIGADAFLHFPFVVVQAAFVLGAVFLLGACVREIVRPLTVAAAAKYADEKLLLKERLSSAIEFTNQESQVTNHVPMTDLVVRDAAKHAETLDPRKILPYQLPRLARWAVLLLVAVVGLAFVPEYRTHEFKEREQTKKDVKKEGEKLVSLVKRIEQNTKPAVVNEMKNELKAVEELGQEFRKIPLSKETALRDINDVADKIRKKQEELGENKALRTLERRAPASGSEPSPKQREQLQQKINDLQKKLGTNPPTPDQVEKTKNDLKQALDKLKAAPNPSTPEGKAAKEAMQQSIESAMQQAQENGEVKDALEKAAEGLKSADVDLVAKNITDAVKDLDQMKQQAAKLDKMKKDAQQAGKDLAEQLQKGQAQAAKQTLEKIAKQLEQSNLSEQQKKEIAQELTKALDPAKDYGKVGEHCQKAVEQLAKNDKTGAANSAQAAAEELQKMMDQQAQGQQMAEMMEQLKKSQCQVATGNCQGEKCEGGVCQNPSNGTSGTPKGGKNRGFGDWPDENNKQVPEYSENWDNSGLNRDEKDPKGVTDRGDPKITGTTTPTKLRGQMQNAGPMPGITLKGVSIKGQSNVEMEQSTAAAKQEAEDALNKEQIPKSYQGQVKDYFDSLK